MHWIVGVISYLLQAVTGNTFANNNAREKWLLLCSLLSFGEALERVGRR